MLTNDDIQKLIEVFATKEDFAKLITRDEFGQFRKEIDNEFTNLREAIQALTVSVDKLAKAVGDIRQEYVAISAKVDRMEKWIHQIAKKVGIELKP